MPSLKCTNKLSRKASQKLILMMAKLSNNYHTSPLRTDADVRRFFALYKVDFDDIVEKCRDFSENVPLLENLVGSTLQISKGVTAYREDRITGETEIEFHGPSTVTLFVYWSQFEQSIKHLKYAIEECSFTELHSAIVTGIASIESYLNYRIEKWNKQNPLSPLIDNKQSKVSFDDKINIWIPKMLNGIRFDKSSLNWSNFVHLQNMRDNSVVHAKSSGYSINYNDLSTAINKFPTGIAGTLIDLHGLFNDAVPSIIIRHANMPEVIVVE